MGKLDEWGIYSEKQVKQVGGKYIHTTKFTMNKGLIIYKWYVSVNETNTAEYCLWKNKNSRARKHESRYCVTRQEAVDLAESTI